MADPSPDTDSNDDTGLVTGRGSMRRKRRGVVVLGMILVKLGFVALILVLPSGLAISLGAAHGVALLAVLVSAAVTLVVYKRRGRTLRQALSHRPHYGHGLVSSWSRGKVARMLKHRRHT
jgi:hypothetical protein